ncbi:response regulator [Microbacterium immunditiarum]|uniref:DNA-binding NarL/FixJ family response regulator n=1 Tax=Microbacterium immunditiarum TaxID=337480 RepID=A0A7Y9GQ97_9MICO|nr:response regulator transcription factor [Microbacterium immunditiarum]NYE20486.1 DNA-binding NarL/FixJ family response regulator [Microbacterium immunditiarum]
MGDRGAALRVLVADDQELVRAGFRLILERAGLEVVGEAADGIEAVELVREYRPDVVLMDIRMPQMDGIEATRSVVALPSPPKVLVLTTFDLDDHVYGAIRAGASGFLLKDVSPAGLVQGVHVVAAGEAMLSPSVIARLVDRFGMLAVEPDLPPAMRALTERETQIAKLVARGLPNAEIASRLYLSEATVKSYVSRLLSKLDVRDRVQIAVLAYETGFVRPGDRGD